MSTVPQQIVNGVTLGGMYALIALGYTLVYGILLMINFAHSEMFMAGAYFGLLFLNILSKVAFFTSSTIGFILLYVIVFLLAMTCTGILGMLTERFAYRPLRHAPRLAPLISAIGVSLFLQNAALLWISSRSIPFPVLFPVKNYRIAGANVSTLQILIVVSTILLLIGLDTFISKTKIGKAMRATSQDRDAAGLMGVNINSVIALTFFIGPALGGAAGMFSGMYYGNIKYNMGFIPGIKSFTAAVIGGIGNLRGAMLGGFILGFIEAIAAGFLSSGYKDVIAFLILILVLIFRPGGLLGESVVEKV
ncbi:MAG: branched-chain amino acid ABC transporter permease [Coriobacteriia bacterium]|nr:branched-chain amino acid ABC transporter permease [Coriobacteriia bacterium]MBN2821934.1 branched-chain amino acid ABC transporter permease [Coriobacteriia bacterium]